MTKQELVNLTNANITDNSNRENTAARVREVIEGVIDELDLEGILSNGATTGTYSIIMTSGSRISLQENENTYIEYLDDGSISNGILIQAATNSNYEGKISYFNISPGGCGFESYLDDGLVWANELSNSYFNSSTGRMSIGANSPVKGFGFNLGSNYSLLVGVLNTIYSQRSIVTGQYGVSYDNNEIIHSAGRFGTGTSKGNAQTKDIIFKGTTTDASKLTIGTFSLAPNTIMSGVELSLVGYCVSGTTSYINDYVTKTMIPTFIFKNIGGTNSSIADYTTSATFSTDSGGDFDIDITITVTLGIPTIGIQISDASAGYNFNGDVNFTLSLKAISTSIV
jgi:hypothetical protein